MKKILIVILSVLGILSIWFETAFPQEVPRLTKEQLRPMLGNPDVIIIDVRIGPEWANSSKKIKGAIREEPGAVGSWMDNYPKDKTLVFYCS